MISMLKNFIGTLRQLLYPFEFRISKSAWPPQLSERLAKAIGTAALAVAEAAKANKAAAIAQEAAAKQKIKLPLPPDATATLQDRLKYLADVGTGLWRMRRAMVQPGWVKLLDARPMTEMQRPFRWLESAEKRFKEFGLEIQDHNGDRYISGQSLEATFQPAPDLHEDMIVETILPTIYFDKKRIQMGNVIVGTPDLEEPESSKQPATTPPPPTTPPASGKSYFAT